MTIARTFERRVRADAERHHLYNKGERLLVGLSGGADSVALLLVLRALGQPVVAAHCNFGLRGAEADGDEAFVRALCHRHGVELHATRYDTRALAAARHVSLEMAARDLRYDYFARLGRQLGIELTAVAHHREDNVETILLNLVRGTGLQGLCGMAWRREGVVRPLLGVTRADIEAYLSARGETYVTDATNLQPVTKRNVLRLDVVPRLRQLNPSFDDAVLRLARNCGDAQAVCRSAADKALLKALRHEASAQVLPAEAVHAFAAPRLLLHHWLAPHGFSGSQLDDVLAALGGSEERRFLSPAGPVLCCSARSLVLLPAAPAMAAPMQLLVPGTTRPAPTLTVHSEWLQGDVWPQMNRSPRHAYIDAATIPGPLTLRPVARGDRFRPLGMQGSKLVSDYLTNLKIPAHSRHREWVVTTQGGHIVWLVSRRLAAPYALTLATTRALHLWTEA